MFRRMYVRAEVERRRILMGGSIKGDQALRGSNLERAWKREVSMTSQMDKTEIIIVKGLPRQQDEPQVWFIGSATIRWMLRNQIVKRPEKAIKALQSVEIKDVTVEELLEAVKK
ncbi:MAG: hypothetical protein ABSD49_12765 [Candidatus Bathyarchaeia archaeon]